MISCLSYAHASNECQFLTRTTSIILPCADENHFSPYMIGRLEYRSFWKICFGRIGDISHGVAEVSMLAWSTWFITNFDQKYNDSSCVDENQIPLYIIGRLEYRSFWENGHVL